MTVSTDQKLLKEFMYFDIPKFTDIEPPFKIVPSLEEDSFKLEPVG